MTTSKAGHPHRGQRRSRGREQFDVITAWAKQYKPIRGSDEGCEPEPRPERLRERHAHLEDRAAGVTVLPLRDRREGDHDRAVAGDVPDLNPGNAGWRASLLNNVQAAIADSGFDGVFLDTLGRGALTYTVTGHCIDPQPGVGYTIADWERSTSELARPIREQIGRFTVANGASSGIVYFDPPPSSVRSTWMAGWPRDSRGTAPSSRSANSESQIVKDVAMVADGPVMHVLTKDWRAVAEGTKDQEMRYAFATFLLGTDGNDVFGWTGSRGR